MAGEWPGRQRPANDRAGHFGFNRTEHVANGTASPLSRPRAAGPDNSFGVCDAIFSIIDCTPNRNSPFKPLTSGLPHAPGFCSASSPPCFVAAELQITSAVYTAVYSVTSCGGLRPAWAVNNNYTLLPNRTTTPHSQEPTTLRRPTDHSIFDPKS